MIERPNRYKKFEGYVHQLPNGKFVVAEIKDDGRYHAPMTKQARKSIGAYTVTSTTLADLQDSLNVYKYDRKRDAMMRAASLFSDAL